MSNPVALATLFDKPTPVDEQPAKAAALLHAKLARTEAEEDAGPIAPYQAKPISGAISRNYTPALDVLEHRDLDQQVRPVEVSRAASTHRTTGRGAAH